MKYSYNWLQELSGTEKTPEQLAEFLTMRAFEVEEVERVGFNVDNVIIGEVVELEKHPNADRLRVAKVNVGGDEALQIVCGAPNIASGQKVPVALVGAVLPGNFEIKQSKIRGIDSNGMVCSQKELGLGDSHEGIMVLAESAIVGALFKDYLRDEDYLLDIKVLPDRAHDALSHVGMAREIAALEGKELDYDYTGLSLSATGSDEFNVTIEDSNISSRYVGALIKDIEVKPSPTWLRNRLQKLGIRSINNIVDVTNFVMMELGQPLHIFDWDTIASGANSQKHIEVRRAKKGEKIKLLDEKEYVLDGEDIVIADSEKALALAGVMGGLHSGVTEKTKNIFLECAHFDATMIRKTRSRLNVRTDASDRFEKDLDPNLAGKTTVRALELLGHLTGKNDAQIIDAYNSPIVEKVIRFSLDRAKKLLGIEISPLEVQELLPHLGFVVAMDGNEADISVPTYRLDINYQEDIIEELGRMKGYDAIPAIAPLVSIQGTVLNEEISLERKIKTVASDNGLTEAKHYSFYSRESADMVGMKNVSHIEVANPMNPDQVLMRASLLPHILESVRENLKHQKSVRIFESGQVYFMSDSKDIYASDMFASAIALENESTKEPFCVMKGLLGRILAELGVEVSYDTADDAGSYWHPTRTGDVFGSKDGQLVHVGRLGEIHPFVLEHYHIKKRIAYFELDYALLSGVLLRNKQFIPLRRYPEVLRDVSLFVPAKVRVKDIVDNITAKGGEFVLQSELFDTFFDKEKNMKSLAFHIRFGAVDRTLSGEEVDGMLEEIVQFLSDNLKVERRA